MKTLIVEADAEFREHLALRLVERGFEVVTTAAAEEAARLVRDQEVRAVILGLSGLRRKALAALADIRALCPASRVILINRAGDVSLSIEAMKLGASDEVTAPVDVEMLERKLLAVDEEN